MGRDAECLETLVEERFAVLDLLVTIDCSQNVVDLRRFQRQHCDLHDGGELTSAGGFKPHVDARFHLSSRVMPTAGP